MTSLPNNYSEARMKRGMEILEKGTKIAENKDGSFSVPSQTSNSVYEVRLIDKVWVCSCPDFENREVEFCKHIYAVKFWIGTKCSVHIYVVFYLSSSLDFCIVKA